LIKEDKLMAPKGRMTVRKGGSALKDGATMRLWDFGEAPAGSTMSKLENRAYSAALDAIDKLEAHRAEVAKSGRYTDSGVAEEVRRFALSELVPGLHRGRQEVAAAKREAAERRLKLTLQPVDKTDMVGELRRQEWRRWLRDMPRDERNTYLAKNMDGLDPQLALAMRRGPQYR
jgi:hypothetical protein